MGKREISASGVILIILVSAIVGVGFYVAYINDAFAYFGLSPGNVSPGGGGQPVDLGTQETSLFSVVLAKEGAPATLITSETAAIWCDWNGDGVMQTDTFTGYDVDTGLSGGELEPAASAATTAVLTSPSQYPIGVPIWIMVDTGKDSGGRDYQVSYAKVTMTGHPHTDGSAISMGVVYCRATDDAVDYAGLMMGTAVDDSTDYNYTAHGTSGTFELRCLLSTQFLGVASQTNPTFYAGSGSYYNWVDGINYAPTFIGFYMTTQDFIDLGADTTGFDLVYQGASNTYCAIFLDSFDSNPALFYSASDTTAPTFTFSFGVSITAAGAITYIGLYQDVKWSNFVLGIWGDTTDNQILGTLGADWDWVA
jgi:hypothetical protein